MKSRCLCCLAIAGRLALGGILAVGTGDVRAAPPTDVLKQAIHWGISADWLDPAGGGMVSGHIPLYLFHDALVKPMPGGMYTGLYTPSLAESWTASPDAKVYEFKLRKGVKFHNGDTMTAEDVVFSFWRYKAAQAKVIHAKTEKVEAVNPYLVRFHFKEPFPDFLEYLIPGTTSIGWIVPKKYVEKVGDAGFKKHPIGADLTNLWNLCPASNWWARPSRNTGEKCPMSKEWRFTLSRSRPPGWRWLGGER